MPERDDLRRRIHDYVVANFMFDAADITDDASLSATGVLDSMGILEMVLFVEESLGVPVADEDVLPEHFDTVDALVEFVSTRRPAAVTAGAR
jgi:acyl carrier protein